MTKEKTTCKLIEIYGVVKTPSKIKWFVDLDKVLSEEADIAVHTVETFEGSNIHLKALKC